MWAIPSRYPVFRNEFATHSQVLLEHLLHRLSIESFRNLPEEPHLREHAERCRESNRGGFMATLQRLALNALRLDGYLSKSERLAALANDIQSIRHW